MPRRLVTGMMLALTLFAIQLGTAAEQGQHSEHHGQQAGQHQQGAYEECAKACNACELACEMCASHCAMLVAEGHKEHLATLRSCMDCAKVCAAAAQIVAGKGPFSDLICVACAEACKRCGEACEKFADDPMMKMCAEECRKCEKACRAMVGSTQRQGGQGRSGQSER